MNEREALGPDTEETTGQQLSKQDKQAAAFDKLVDWFIEFDPFEVRLFVEEYRRRHPDLTERELVNQLINVKSVQNGLLGAAMSVPGFLALPLTLPADLLMSWKIQINLAMCIAYIYGHDMHSKDPSELKTDIYMVLAGRAAEQRLRVLGIQIDAVTKNAMKRYLNREILGEVWKQIGRQIAIAATRNSATRLTRMVPLLGAPVGFAFDYAATRSVGAFARQYYGDDFAGKTAASAN